MNYDEEESLASQRSKIKNNNQEKYDQAFRKDVNRMASTHIRTSFIGSIAAFEEEFDWLWVPEEGEKMTDEQKEFLESWNITRKRILDLGNNLIRKFEAELSEHKFHWGGFQLTTPIKPRKGQ